MAKGAQRDAVSQGVPAAMSPGDDVMRLQARLPVPIGISYRVEALLAVMLIPLQNILPPGVHFIAVSQAVVNDSGKIMHDLALS